MKIQTLRKTQAIIIAAVLAVLIPSTTFAESGFIVGASVGSAELSDNFDGFDVDANSTAYRFTVSWKFNDYLAVQGGYHNFGRFDQTFDIEGEAVDLSLKADGFTLGLVGILPLGDRWSLFARSGAFFWDGDADINNVSAATPEDTNFYFGAGVQFAIGEKLSLTADGSRYDLDGSASNVFSIGMNYTF
jgi:OOP family OmpA-OmpF porin